jgi:two-component system sensor histidine kinase HydH
VATVTAALLDLIPGAPSFGNIFITIYLYFLSQTLARYRLLDLNELLGRMVVLATLVMIATVIYGLLLVKWVELDELGVFFLNALVASTAIIIVFEPLRTRLERVVNRWMFQEKYELFRRIETLRTDLMNVIDVRDLVPRVLSALEASRRVTHASLYTVDPDGSAYELAGHVGPRPEARLDAVAYRAFLERLRRAGVVSIEGLERELAALRNTQSEERESLLLMVRALELLNGSVVLAVIGEEQLLGMLVLRDERLREAYSSEEIELFRGVAASIGVTLQNSQVYERMKERDRLAALGQMAAGLAHEIRNPLGSIKGAAQFLQPTGSQPADAAGTREFLGIIVEEVDRLNKIVSQFLDYARPYRGDQNPLDVNDVVRKTLHLVDKERSAERGDLDQLHRSTAPGAGRCSAVAAGVSQPDASTRSRPCPRAESCTCRPACADPRAGAQRPHSWRFVSVTRAWASRPGISATSSFLSSRPKNGARAWACPSASASSRTTAEPSRCVRSQAPDRRFPCSCR